ncbi:MAG: S8 family serine peptidase [Thermoplasmatota archaeon]
MTNVVEDGTEPATAAQKASVLDLDLQDAVGTTSVLIHLDGPLSDSQRLNLLNIQGLIIVQEFRYVNGVWAFINAEHLHALDELDFVKRVEWDPVLEPQLSTATSAIRARDSRNIVIDSGAQQSMLRGAWTGEGGDYTGFSGKGVTVALMDGGIDDSHPSINDMDDDPATEDAKVRLRLNAWGYALANFTVGAAGNEVNASAPWVVPKPEIPEADPLDLVVTTVSPYFDPYSATACSLTTFTVEPLLGLPPGTIPCLGTAGQAVQPVDDTISRLPGMDPILDTYNGLDLNRFTTLPHATALAGQIAGTGDTLLTDGSVHPAGRWMYPGAAPGASLADVNVFIGMDTECVEDVGCFPLNSEPGSTVGVQVGSANQVAVAGAGSFITGTELILAHNEQYPDDQIEVVVIPLLDVGTCAEDDGGTLAEQAVDTLAQTNVTVIVSQGQGREEGVCAPANVPTALTVGAIDHQGTIENEDDIPWPSMDQPNDDGQRRIAKPELTAPGVDIIAPRSRPESYELTSGSSAAAAIAAGVAAIAIEANNHTDRGLALKEFLIQTARDDMDNRLDASGFTDGPDERDGLHDEGNRTNWLSTWGFGIIDARNAVCEAITCPAEWESLATSLTQLPSQPWPTFAKVREPVAFHGQVTVSDARANNFWMDRDAEEYYQFFGGAEGVRVHFGFTSSSTPPPIADLVSQASAVTDENGLFALNLVVPDEKPPGPSFCALWTEPLAGSDNRDGLLAASPVGCILNVASTTQLTIDLCGESPGCNPSAPILSFQNEPTVDLLQGTARLTDAADKPLELKQVNFHWEGAEPQFQNQVFTTNEGDGEVLLKVPFHGVPGTYNLTMSYIPKGTDVGRFEGITATIPVSISVGSTLDLSFQGIPSGTVFVNDNAPIPISFQGTLRTQLGDPVPNVELAMHVEGKGDRIVGTVTTGPDGSFTGGFDAQQFLSGVYNLYASFGGKALAGSEQFTVTPTESQRVPFSLVVTSEFVAQPTITAYRGETLTIEGELLNSFARPLGNRTVEIQWLGSKPFVEIVQTNRDGEFEIERELSLDEPLGTSIVRLRFNGDPDTAPSSTVIPVEVRGSSALAVFPEQGRRGDTVDITGFLFDDQGKPVTGQPINLTLGSDPLGDAVTNSLGQFLLSYTIPLDQRTGPLVIRALFEGLPQMDGSNAQGILGVVADTKLVIEGTDGKSSNGVLEFGTRLVDESGQPLNDIHPIDLYLTEPRPSEQAELTYLAPFDLSSALSPELQIRQSYDFVEGFGVSEGARLQVSLDGGDRWTTIQPREGYTSQRVSSLEGPGWTGTTNGWFPMSFNLTQYNEDEVQLRWRLATNALDNEIAFGVDNVKVADGNTVLFEDDFEFYGVQTGGNYWQVQGFGSDPFQVGHETFTGNSLGVLASNLAGTYPGGASMEAKSPRFNIPEGDGTFVLLRYQLDVGDVGDVATLKVRQGGNEPVLLQPLNEPGFSSLPETNEWRWMVYQVPSNLKGPSGQLILSFNSNNALQGTGFMVDEIRTIFRSDLTPVPLHQNWGMIGFEYGSVVNQDTFDVEIGTTASRPARSGFGHPLFDAPIVLQAPFELDLFGETSDLLTVHPEGIATLGDTQAADLGTACQVQSGQFCSITDLKSIGAPAYAVAWDPAFIADQGRIVTELTGTAPHREWTIEWQNLRVEGEASNGAHFSLTIHESKDVEMQYDSMFFGSSAHDLGANATVGIGLPSVAGRVIEPLSLKGSLTDGRSVYFSRLEHNHDVECENACNALQPTGSIYNPSEVAELILNAPLDLGNAGEAYLMVRQYTALGEGDILTVQARPTNLNSWRSIPAIMGGESASNGRFSCDCEAEWRTVAYSLNDLIGNQVQIRIQLASNGADEDVGLLIRDMFVIAGGQRSDDRVVHGFNDYVAPGGSDWWTRSIRGLEDSASQWRKATHSGAAEELGGSYMGVGDGQKALAPNREYYLLSPLMDLRGTSNPTLDLWNWVQIDRVGDGAVLEISTDGGKTFGPLESPVRPYEDYVPRLNSAGWNQDVSGLTTETFDLTPFAGSDVRLRVQAKMGATPFGAQWTIDDIRIVDRIEGTTLFEETGEFSPGRWSRGTGWSEQAGASAISFQREGFAASLAVQAPGSATLHRVALPATQQVGELQVTALYRGLENTFAGAMVQSNLVVQDETLVKGVSVRNFHDQGAYAVRGKDIEVSGQVVKRDGTGVEDGLVQILLDDVILGSTRTTSTGDFTSPSIRIPDVTSLGKHVLKVEFVGDQDQYQLAASATQSISILGQSSSRIISQVADGDQFIVQMEVKDDLGNPLPKTAVLVRFIGSDERIQAITDGNGVATFATSVDGSVAQDLQYEVESLGTTFLLGTQETRSVTVPAESVKTVWPWFVAGAVFLLLLAVLIFFLIRKKQEAGLAVEEQLDRKLQTLQYRLERGDSVRDAVFDAYKQFLKLLHRTGKEFRGVETPGEIQTIITPLVPSQNRADVADITRLFEQARYSVKDMGAVDRSLAIRSVTRMRAALVPEVPE